MNSPALSQLFSGIDVVVLDVSPASTATRVSMECFGNPNCLDGLSRLFASIAAGTVRLPYAIFFCVSSSFFLTTQKVLPAIWGRSEPVDSAQS